MKDEQCFDAALRVAAQSICDLLDWRAGAELNFQPFNIDPVSRGGTAKQVAEMTVNAAEDFIARGKRVDDRGFPRAGA